MITVPSSGCPNSASCAPLSGPCDCNLAATAASSSSLQEDVSESLAAMPLACCCVPEEEREIVFLVHFLLFLQVEREER